MSFFSKIFKCCDTNHNIQNETKSELLILSPDPKSTSALQKDNILPTSPKLIEKVENFKARPMNKELSFFNLEVANGGNSPKKRPKAELGNEGEKNSFRTPNKEISFINLEVSNSPTSPKKGKKAPKLNLKQDENFDECDMVSLANENFRTESPKKKKDRMKMDLKFATLGDFELNNNEKNDKEDFSPRFKTGIKTLKSLLNEEDCDIALSKKPFKKFNTSQENDVKKNNNQMQEIAIIKKKFNEIKDSDKTPIFDDKKQFKF